MVGFYAGVIRKKYSLFCVSPDGAQIEVVSCFDKLAAETSKLACEKIMGLMVESFSELEAGFFFKIEESMQSAEEVPMTEVNPR